MTLIEGRTGEWEVVVGLEIHAQAISRAQAMPRPGRRPI